MKTKSILQAGIAIVMFVAGVWILRDHPDDTAMQRKSFADVKLPKDAPGVLESEQEERENRESFEFLRLRDPNTNTIPVGIKKAELAFARTIPSREALLAKGAQVQALAWSKRGPRNVGGRTRAFGMDASNSSIMLAAGVSGGMWRSTNGGSAWTKVTVADALHSATCLVQDTRSGKTATWYYGTGELIGNSAAGGSSPYRGDGVLKSTDNGLTWKPLKATATGVPQSFDQTFDYVWNIGMDYTNSSQDELYAATLGAIMRTTDGGTSWSFVRGSGSTSDSRYTDVVVTNTGVVYAAMSTATSLTGTSSALSGIWRSTDGLTWVNILPASFPTSYSRIVIGIAPSNQNILYFLVEGTDGIDGGNQINGHQLWKYTYLSGTGGGTGGQWENRGQNLPSESGLDGNAVFDSQGGYDMIVRVKPDDPNFVVVGAVNLYRSTDGFATSTNWKRIGGYASASTYAVYANQHPDHHSGFFHPANSKIFYSGNDGGLQITMDITAATVTWNVLNDSYVTSQFYTIAMDHAGTATNLLIGGTQDNGSWLTEQASPDSAWDQLLGGDGAFAAVQAGGDFIFVSSQGGRTYRLSTNGTFARVDPAGGSDFLFINPFLLDPAADNRVYMLAGTALFRNPLIDEIPLNNTNDPVTANWTSLAKVGALGNTWTALACSKLPVGRAFLGSVNGKIYRLDTAHVGDPTPVDVWTGKGLPANAYVSSIAVDPSNADRVLAVFSNYSVASLFYSSNGGTTWTNVGGNLEQNVDGTGNGPSCRWGAIVPFGGGLTFFVGTSTGLYSANVMNGSSTMWMQEGAPTIGNVVVDMIDFRTTDGTVVVATHGNGVYSARLSSTSYTVYPGDANNDGVVDVRDILPIGRYFGKTGPARSGGGTWGPQALLSSWSTFDACYADCDGNGTVNAVDATILVQNWGGARGGAVPANLDKRAACEELIRVLDSQPQSSEAVAMRNALSKYLSEELGSLPQFELLPNYPNPFNPGTRIRFALPAAAPTVQVDVFDVTGRMVWSQHLPDAAAGYHTVEWNGVDGKGIPVAGGTYICRVQAGPHTAYRKLLFIK